MTLERKRVAVVHESDVVQRGLEACLADGPLVEVVASVGRVEDLPEGGVDVAVVSRKALGEWSGRGPIVLCVGPDEALLSVCDDVFAVVSLATVTSEQLWASAHAAAVGLRVEPAESPSRATNLRERSQAVIRLLADGATTRTIAETLCYSERTVKTLIHDVERELGATTRAQAVANAARLGLI